MGKGRSEREKIAQRTDCRVREREEEREEEEEEDYKCSFPLAVKQYGSTYF